MRGIVGENQEKAKVTDGQRVGLERWHSVGRILNVAARDDP
jgi:hypothetical protein